MRRFLVEDYFNVNRRRFDALTFLNFPNPKKIAYTLAAGEAWTAVGGRGEIVACGGVVPFWTGVGEVWVVTSAEVLKHRIEFLRISLRKVWEMQEKYERLQTTVDAEHKASIRWVEWMGFEAEGVMRKYIGGRNHIRYAWVKGE